MVPHSSLLLLSSASLFPHLLVLLPSLCFVSFFSASSALPSAGAAQAPRKEKKERHYPDPSKTKFKPHKTGKNEVSEESEAEPEPPKTGKGKSGAGQGRKPGNRHPSKKSVKDSLLEEMRAAAERKDFDTVSKLADALKALKRVSE